MRIRSLGMLLSLLILIASPALAVKEEGIFEISTGFREDRLRWSITERHRDRDRHHRRDRHRDHHKNDKLMSELRWKGLHIGQIMATANYVNCYRIYFRGRADYGRILEGKETDTDFYERRHRGIGSSDSSSNFSSSSFRDSRGSGSSSFNYSNNSSEGSSSSSRKHDRKHVLMRSRARADKGEVFDLLAGIGYQFRFLCGRATISPVGGYSYHAQHLRMDHLEVVIDKFHGLTGHVDGLHSNYRTRWKGPWLGADFTLYMTCVLKLYGSFEFHWTHFHARGHWNLRKDYIKDFQQHAFGRGQVYILGASYDLWKNWTLGIVGNYQAWRTCEGTDRIYLRSGPVRNRLHSVHWHTMSTMVSFGRYF